MSLFMSSFAFFLQCQGLRHCFRAWLSGPRWQGRIVAAARRGNLKKVQRLWATHGEGSIDQVVAPSFRDYSRFYHQAEGKKTLLFHAAASGNLALVEWLVDQGADVTRLTSFGNTPILVAAAHGDVEMVSFLASRGADPKEGGPAITTLVTDEKGPSALDLLRFQDIAFTGSEHLKAKARELDALLLPPSETTASPRPRF